MQDLRDEDIKIPVNFDVESVQDDINRATRGARAGAVKVPLELDSNDLEAQIARVTQELRDLDGQEVSPEVILQATDLRAELQQLKAELAALSAQEYDVRVGEDGITAVRAEAFGLRAALDDLERNPVQVEFDLKENDLLRKIASIEASLSELDGKTVTPEVQAQIDAALAKLAAFNRQLEELDNKRIEAIAELDIGTRIADARIAAFIARMKARRKIELDVDVDNDSIGRASNSILRGIGNVLENIGSLISRSFEGIGAAITNIGGLTRGFVTAGLAVGRLVLLVGQLSAISIGLTVAGAGITAAWGAVSTALADIPAAIALIGVPIAAVALGLDGIKAAAAGIGPQFDKLKASVSEVFERGLTPVLQRLATATFPTLQAGLRGTAAVLVELAREMSNVVIRATEVGQLKTIFDNVNNSIRLMTPGITDLTKGFLLLTQQKAAFDVLTTAVNTFGAAFRQNVLDTINDGSLTAAFKGLEGVLASLAIGFADLVENGIKVFAAAAPGLKSFIDDLTGFFNRFDWTSLGESVGGVFRGLGEAIRGIPQGTIDAFEASFRRLSETFQSPGFQGGLQAIIGLLPGVIDWVGRLADAFLRNALAISGSVDVIVGSVKSIALALQALTDDPTLLFSEKFRADLDAANKQVTDGLTKIEQSYATFDPQIPPSTVPDQLGGELDTVVATAEQKMAALKAALAKGMTEAQSALVGGWAGTGSATVAAASAALAPVAATASVQGKGVFEAWDAEMDAMDGGTKERLRVVGQSVGGELGKVPGAAATAVAPTVPAVNTALAPLQQLEALVGMRDQFTLAAADSMHAMSVGVQSGMAEVQQQFIAGMDTASSGVNTSFGLIGQGFTIGMAGLATTVSQGMVGVQTSFTTGLNGIAAGVTASFAPITTAVQVGIQGLITQVRAGMPQILLAFTTGWDTVSTSMNTSFQLISSGLSVQMASLATAVGIGFVGVQAAFAAGLAGLTTSVQFAFSTGLTGAVAIGMAQVATAVSNGFQAVHDTIIFNGTIMQAALNVAIGLMATNAQTQMQFVANAVDAGMQGVTEAVNSNMIIAQQAMTDGFIGLADGVGVQMDAVAQTVATGMVLAASAITTGTAGMAAAAAAGMLQVASSIQNGMAQAVAAVEAAGARIGAAGVAAMAQFGQAIVAGMSQATSAVAAGTAQMNNQFTQLGQQIITTANQSMAQFGAAVRAGMNSAVSAVQAGVASMVGALRAGQGQFHGIGVAMMQGLRAGILSQAGSIAAAAAQVVRGAVAAARAEAQVRSPSRVFMGIGANMGEGLAIGMEQSGSRVAQAADRMANSAIDSFDSITSRVADADWADGFAGKVEASFGDTTLNASSADVVGAIRRQSGDLDQSATLSSILSVLLAMHTQAKQGSNVALGAQGSRTRAELGAF